MKYNCNEAELEIERLTKLVISQNKKIGELATELYELKPLLEHRNLVIEQLKQRWVPVSERLPKDNQEVLYFQPRRDKNKQPQAIFGAIFSEYNYQNNTNWLAGITHWMPLPEAPEGE